MNSKETWVFISTLLFFCSGSDLNLRPASVFVGLTEPTSVPVSGHPRSPGHLLGVTPEGNDQLQMAVTPDGHRQW